MGDIPLRPGPGNPDFGKSISGIAETMESFASALADYPARQREIEDKLLKQENAWQSHRDRVSNLPADIAFGIRSDIYSAIQSTDSIGAVHGRIKDILAEAEDRHWRKCAEWLLAERDWKDSQKNRYNIVVNNVEGAQDELRRRAQLTHWRV